MPPQQSSWLLSQLKSPLAVIAVPGYTAIVLYIKKHAHKTQKTFDKQRSRFALTI